MHQAQTPAPAPDTRDLQVHIPPSGSAPGPRRGELPPAGVVRWVARRKAQVVTAVRDGVLTLEEACSRYALSVEEFCGWQQRFEREGLRGLRARPRRP